jgi:hypothetical protein
MSLRLPFPLSSRGIFFFKKLINSNHLWTRSVNHWYKAIYKVSMQYLHTLWGKVWKAVKSLKMAKFKGDNSSKKLVDSNHLWTRSVSQWYKAMYKVSMQLLHTLRKKVRETVKFLNIVKFKRHNTSKNWSIATTFELRYKAMYKFQCNSCTHCRKKSRKLCGQTDRRG